MIVIADNLITITRTYKNISNKCVINQGRIYVCYSENERTITKQIDVESWMKYEIKKQIKNIFQKEL